MCHAGNSGQLAVSQHTIDLIRGLTPPMNTSKLRSMLGLGNVFPGIVPNIVRIEPLQNRKFQEDQLTHFETLNENESLTLPRL